MTAQQARARRDTLIRIRPGTCFQSAAFAHALLGCLQRDVIGLTGSRERDVAKWSLELEEEGTVGEIVGYSHEGLARVWLAFFSETDESVGVMIAATKGNVAASYKLFGETGPGIGNRLHVARILDLGVECAVCNGAKLICNDPVNDRVRDLYTAMGFENGERLDLTNTQSLGAMCRFLDQVYDGRGPAMPAFVRPW